ncbi:MAG: ArnT family glycosyltransferase [Lentimicrobium sp.]
MQLLSKKISNQGSTILKVLLFLVLAYFPFFLHLGDLPVRIWDEARLIANTLEMAGNGNLLVPHFEGIPDMWNTKPPLMIWLQLLFLKLAGNQELSFRLPSAIAGFLTASLIMLIFYRHIKDYWTGLMAVLVLITANGFIGDHVARTGDYDALLTLFTTFYAISFFLFSETGKQKYLHLFFAGIILAIFTKSVQGLLFLPAIAIYVLISGDLLKLLRNRWLYIDLTVVVAIVAAYYLLRESANPGYLKAVFTNELGGRYLSTTENHRHEFTWYLNLLMTSQFAFWFLFVPAGWFTGFFLNAGILKRLTVFSGILLLFYLLIISLAGTKLEWYVAPMYPFLALLAALVISRIFSLLSERDFSVKSVWRPFLPFIFLMGVFVLPYQQVINKVYKPRETEKDIEFYMISHFLQDAVKGKHSLQNHVVSYEGYNSHLKYYTDRLNQQGMHVLHKDTSALETGDQIICSQYFTREFIRKQFLFREQGSYYNVKIYSIDGIRTKED